MTTAIIGIASIGSTLARNLVRGGERIVLVDRDQSKALTLARKLGDRATAAGIIDAIDAAGKVVVDPSNPVGPDGKGGMMKTISENRSSGQIIARLLPEGALFVKAFGTLGAASLASGASRTPERAVLFYATDDGDAGEAVARLITATGFDPVFVGGVDESIRLEVGGDLHEFGGLNGKLLTVTEADALTVVAVA